MATVKEQVYDVLTADASLSAIIGSNLYYNMLPQRTNVSDPAISFTVRTNETIRDLQGEIIYKDMNVNIRIHSNEIEEIYDILDLVETDVDTLRYQQKEIDDDPFFDDTINWFILDMNFQINQF